MNIFSRITSSANSLIAHLLAAASIVNFILLPIGFWFVFSTATSVFRDNFVDSSLQTARLTSEHVSVYQYSFEDADIKGQKLRIVDVLDSVILSGNIVYAELVGEKEILYSSFQEDLTKVDFQEDVGFGDNDDNIYFVSVTVWLAKDESSDLRLGFDESVVEASIHMVRERYILFFVAFFITFNIVFFLLGQFIIAPLKKISISSQSIAKGNWTHKLRQNSSLSEIKGLSHDLEAMRYELVAQANQLERLSQKDILTGIPNRLLLNDRLEQDILTGERSKVPFTLLLLDLNGFKEVNDTLGHHAGDGILQETALRLLGAMRVSDTVSRLGGDEFAIILPNTTLKESAIWCGKIVELFKAPYVFTKQTVQVGCSIGVAAYPQHGVTSEILMRKADLAMYFSKRNNLPYKVFSDLLDEDHSERFEIRTHLQKGLDNGEFEVHFQPKIEAKTGRISGFEALCRWHSKDLGYVLPDQFIEVAEQTGFIDQLTEFVIEEALIANLGWEKQGYDLGVAVNISPKNLMDDMLLEKIFSLIEKYNFDPSRLELELTENQILAEPLHAIGILEEISSAGIGIAIDDFGTGYSSLAYLVKFPVQTLKIDKSFTMSLCQDDASKAIVKASIEMAHNIGLKVVAEGAEDERSVEYLKSWGCDWIQGYYYSKPIPNAEVISLLSRYN